MSHDHSSHDINIDAIHGNLKALSERLEYLGERNSLVPNDQRQPRRLLDRHAEAERRFEEIMGPLLARLNSLSQEVAGARVRGQGVSADLKRELASLASDFIVTLEAYEDDLLDLFPNNAVRVFETASLELNRVRSLIKKDHIYLDVTDATLEEVRKIWPAVWWAQKLLRKGGRCRKRAQGESGPRDPEVLRWVERARLVGVTQARAEFKTEKSADEWAHWREWWRRVVRPHVTKISGFS